MAELPDFSAVPVYQTFFEQPELYERYHIHLIGLTGGTGGGIQNSLNRLGFTKLRDAVADPYVSLSMELPPFCPLNSLKSWKGVFLTLLHLLFHFV
jgi:hypothetical protein